MLVTKGVKIISRLDDLLCVVPRCCVAASPLLLTCLPDDDGGTFTVQKSPRPPPFRVTADELEGVSTGMGMGGIWMTCLNFSIGINW